MASDPDIFEQQLTASDFERICKEIYTYCGIRITPVKKQMVEGRLRKRMRDLGIKRYGDYCAFVFHSGDGEREFIHLVDVITTNKTEFYREPNHFAYLRQKILPQLCESGCYRTGHPLQIWSAACSTGQEPYSLAMELSEFNRQGARLGFHILGTDISTKVLETAERAVYTEESVAALPFEFKRRYLLKSRDPKRAEVRIVPELRRKVEFRRLNFMDDNYGHKAKKDIIFCRNAIIYFDRKTQEEIICKLADCLHYGGYLFLGHSEATHGMTLPLRSVAPTIYERI